MPSDTAEHIEFKAEIKQLLDILIHALYTEREVFLRELVSNASDALSRVKLELLKSQAQVHDPEAELAIWLEPEPEKGRLVVRDSGVGMSQQELVENLGTIAHSGAKAFVEHLRELNGGDSASSREVIGQFGVGFYSVFMVADQVRVTSRSARPEAEAAYWRSDGQGSFEVGPAAMEARGTRIELELKEDARAFAQPERLRDIVKRHSNYVPFPIYLRAGDGWERLNSQSALWRERPQTVSSEQYASFYQQLTFDHEEPLRTLHVTADMPLQFYALLFLPRRRERLLLRGADDYGLTLYARKVLIQEKFKGLLPPYLRFVEGVVDSEDLPLNVSRESVQATPLIARLRKVLSGRVSSDLEQFAQEDPEGYQDFFREFGVFLKEGVASDPSSAQVFVNLLRFPSSKAEAGALTSLRDYVQRMKREQQDIYYLLGDDLKVAASSSHLDPFRERDLEVLFLTEPIDSFLLMGLSSYEGRPLRNIDEAGLDLPETGPQPLETPADEAVVSLTAFAKQVLGERVAAVRSSKLLTASAARLVNPAGGESASFQRAQRLMGREVSLPKRILELNPRHALVKALAARLEEDANDPLLPVLIEQLYENELLAEGLHPNPAEMIPRIRQLMDAASKSGSSS